MADPFGGGLNAAVSSSSSPAAAGGQVQSLQAMCRAYIDRAGFTNLAPEDPVRSFDEGFHAVFLLERTIRGCQYRAYDSKTQLWSTVARAELLQSLAQWQGTLTFGGPISAIYVLLQQTIADPELQSPRPAQIPCECLCIGFPKEGTDRATQKPVPIGGHIDLAGARNILAAGEIRFSGKSGTVTHIDNSSGHYQPWENPTDGKHPRALLVSAFRLMLAVDITDCYSDTWTEKKLVEVEKARRVAADQMAARMKAQAGLAMKLKGSKVPGFAKGGYYKQAVQPLAQAILRAAGRNPVVDSATVQELLARFARGDTWQQIAVWYASSLGIDLPIEALL